VATFEDAAEQLVIKLKGLDAEIEESQHALEELGNRVDAVSGEVDEAWSGLTEAVSSVVDTLREVQEQLAGDAQEALQAAGDARLAIDDAGEQARPEVDEARTGLDALSEHAAALTPGVESLVEEGAEAPARHLARRAEEIGQELERLLDEACGFLQEDVVAALGRVSEEIRDRCQGLRVSLAEESATALEHAFDEWEARVDDLEGYVAERGFVASHSHARAFVDWALEEAREVCMTRLDGVQAVADESARPLRELAAAVEEAGAALAGSGSELMDRLARTGDSAAQGTSALDAVRDLLASFSFARS
jgi:cell division septum initiation protein DivIVA